MRAAVAAKPVGVAGVVGVVGVAVAAMVVDELSMVVEAMMGEKM